MNRNIVFIISIFCILFTISCEKKTVIEKDNIKYSDIISMNRAEVSSIAGISLDSRWEDISAILNIDIAEMRNNVFNKSLTIENFNARLVIFTDNNNIYQVSLLIEQSANEDDISIFFEGIDKEIKRRIHIEPETNIIENDDGSILEKNITYTFPRKTFFINIGGDYISINIADSSKPMA